MRVVLIPNVSVCVQGSEQSKPIVFAPSAEPTFVNVPFVEPFVLNPGTWTVVIEAEGVLLVRRKHVQIHIMAQLSLCKLLLHL